MARENEPTGTLHSGPHAASLRDVSTAPRAQSDIDIAFSQSWSSRQARAVPKAACQARRVVAQKAMQERAQKKAQRAQKPGAQEAQRVVVRKAQKAQKKLGLSRRGCQLPSFFVRDLTASG